MVRAAPFSYPEDPALPDNTPASGPKPLSADDVRTLLTELRSTASGRNSDYAEARRLYVGRHFGLPGNPTPEVAGVYTLVANYAKPTVDKTVQLLLGQMPGIQVMPAGTDEASSRVAEAEEALLYSVWERNQAELVFRRVAHNMSLLRRGLVYFWWDLGRETVRFRSISPDNFYPVYDGEEIVECVLVSRRLTRSLKQMYPDKADQIVPDTNKDHVFDEGRWTRVVNGQMDALSSDASSPSRRPNPIAGQTTVVDWYDKWGNWVRLMGEAVHSQNLGYRIDKVPVIEFVNSVPGDEREPISDVDAIKDLNLYLDQLLSQDANIIKKFSNPTVLAKKTGQSVQDIRQAVQADGGIIPLLEEGEVSFLNWDGTPPDIEMQFQRVMQMIYDLSGKPPTAYGQIMSNQSGVATNMSLSPATTTTEEKQGIFGMGLVQLNEAILSLTEVFKGGQDIDLRASVPRNPGSKAYRYYQTQLNGSDIGGWYKNRIKWPSALRTDDPIFVQNELAKSKGDATNPPAQSLYTTLERLGTEDVEAEIDRISRQLEDPRLHPDRLQAAVEAAATMQQSMLPTPMSGLDPSVAAANGGSELGSAMTASGSPAGPKSQPGGGRGKAY